MGKSSMDLEVDFDLNHLMEGSHVSNVAKV